MAYFEMQRNGSITKRCFPLSPPSWHRLVSAKRSVISIRPKASVFTLSLYPRNMFRFFIKKIVSFFYSIFK